MSQEDKDDGRETLVGTSTFTVSDKECQIFTRLMDYIITE